MIIILRWLTPCIRPLVFFLLRGTTDHGRLGPQMWRGEARSPDRETKQLNSILTFLDQVSVLVLTSTGTSSLDGTGTLINYQPGARFGLFCLYIVRFRGPYTPLFLSPAPISSTQTTCTVKPALSLPLNNLNRMDAFVIVTKPSRSSSAQRASSGGGPGGKQASTKGSSSSSTSRTSARYAPYPTIKDGKGDAYVSALLPTLLNPSRPYPF